MKTRVLLLTFLLGFSLQFLIAQQLHTNSKKAEKYFHAALNEYTLGNRIQAEINLQKAIKADDNFIEAYLLTGHIKNELIYTNDAITFYKKGISINPDLIPNAHYDLAKIYLAEGIYSEALNSFTVFLSFGKINEKLKEDAEFQIKNCNFAIAAINNPIDFDLQNLGPNINTDKSEYFPTLTVDNQFLLYTRRLVRNDKGFQEDFVGAIKINDTLWERNFPIHDLNTPYNEGASSLSADGKTLIYTVCENFGDYGAGRKGYGSCDLFVSRKIGKRWSKAQNLGPPINTSNWESQPSFSSDGKSIYFIRAPKRAQGNSDIFRADLDFNGYWKKPVRLNSNINTNKDEESVFIHPDNQTLYFSSDGHIGMGKADIFMSKWDVETQDWGPAINLGYPINTHKIESSILVSPDGKTAYFSSEREEGYGELDLYSFRMPKEVQPAKITYFKGVVFNAQTQELLSAQFELFDLESGKQLTYSVSDANDGNFLLTLNLGRDYILNVSKPGYLFYSDQFLMQEEFSNQNPFLQDIPLQPIALGKDVVLKNIFFATDESTLQKASEIELGKLILFLNRTTNVHIEIHGHTDNIGTKEYNLSLSNERAKAVYSFLIEHNIESERLSYKGFGFDKPLAENDTDEGRAQNRRTEFEVVKI